MSKYLLLEEVCNYSDEGFIVTDQSFNVLYYNSKAFNIIELKNNNTQVESFIGKKIYEVFPEFCIIKEKTNKLFKNKKISLTLELENKNTKTEYAFDIFINSFETNHIFKIVNITDKIIDHQKSKQTQNNFMAFLSHELRNPLQSVSLSSHLLNTQIKNIRETKKIELPENVTNYMNTINKSCTEMKRIINDILDLAKLDANEFSIELDNYEIREIIENLVQSQILSAQEKNIDLKVEIKENIPKYLLTDETRITQILTNLVSNAIKYSYKDSSVSILVSYDEKKFEIRFSVTDTGPGIRKEELSNLFKEFGQTSNSYKFNVKSNGLGLYLSKKIASLLDAYIIFKSELGSGSTFCLCHPIKLGSSGNFTKNKFKFDSSKLNGSVLIVDDDQNNVMLFKILLESFRFEYNINLEIHTAHDGYTCIELVKHNNYDIIFMDINMIGIDGCTTTEIIKKEHDFKGKVIATTGNILAKKENQNTGENKFNLFDEIIIKPYEESQILSVLGRFLKT